MTPDDVQREARAQRELCDRLAGRLVNADKALAEANACCDEERRLKMEARDKVTLLLEDARRCVDRYTTAERERDALQRHYDEAGPEHNLLALLDLYDDRKVEAQRERDEAREALAAEKAAHAANVATWMGTRNDLAAANERTRVAEAEVEQRRVQMAGISTVALGGTSKAVRAKRGQYGWSVPYDDVLTLRLSVDARVEAARAEGERAGLQRAAKYVRGCSVDFRHDAMADALEQIAIEAATPTGPAGGDNCACNVEGACPIHDGPPLTVPRPTGDGTGGAPCGAAACYMLCGKACGRERGHEEATVHRCSDHLLEWQGRAEAATPADAPPKETK